MKRALGIAGALAVVLALGFVFRHALLDWFGGRPHGSAASLGAGAGDIDHYTCPMHPSVKQAGPGKCPICGMDLTPVTKAQQAEGVVMIDEGRRQLIGVRTAAVTSEPMRETLRAVGRVAYDESSMTDVSLKVKGWITKLYVTTTGQRVTRGQPLFQLFSPEVYAAQQDWLLATRVEGSGSRVDGLGKASRQRLHLLGLDDATLNAVEKSGTVRENIAFPSPATGFVIEKNVVEGASVDAGARLFRIAALDKVWIEIDVYERDLAHVRVGQPASVSLDYVPGRTYEAKVAYVYPYIDDKARVGRARLELVNRDSELRPGMYARVELAVDLGPRLQVPTEAVVFTGPRRLVFVDLGEGRFRPTEIGIGAEAGGRYEVVSGLRAGDVIATSGVFLIAAEARIATAAKFWETPASDGGPAIDGVVPHEHPTGAPTAAVPGAPSTDVRAASPAMPTSAGTTSPRASSAPSPATEQAPALDYTCPMHPEVHRAEPGTCPKCGMTLILRTDGGK